MGGLAEPEAADGAERLARPSGHGGFELMLGHGVTFHEDRSRIKKENAPENFGLLRRLALCLLKKESTSKRSIKGKRLKAGWDDGYLLRVLCGNAEN